jgi:hypothetical protein
MGLKTTRLKHNNNAGQNHQPTDRKKGGLFNQ